MGNLKGAQGVLKESTISRTKCYVHGS